MGKPARKSKRGFLKGNPPAMTFSLVAGLKPYARNARTHSPEQIEKIRRSILEFGFTNALLIDEAGIVAGHGRALAAAAIYAAGGAIKLPSGETIPHGTVPTVDCSGWSDKQRRAYVIADNQIALDAGWDEALLRIELDMLRAEDFDLSLIGFDPDALAGLLDGPAEPKEPGPGLAERFGLAPFSVLNAREGWWQDRKRAWIALGIRSEVGRGENLLAFSDTINEPDPKKRAAKKAKGGGATLGAIAPNEGTILKRTGKYAARK